ncbi:tetratricopeptide repeat protein [Chloroflexota bacterium]
MLSQIFYPIQEIKSVKNANQQVAVNLVPDFVGVNATEVIPGARILLTLEDETILDETVNLEPGKPFTKKLTADDQQQTKVNGQQSITVLDSKGSELITYSPHKPKNEPLPDTAKPPTLPHKIESIEELYLTGLHVEQYLHSTLDPANYWERALELDPTDSRSNNALGRLRLRRGDFAGAEPLFRKSIQTLTRYNFNPYDGEPYYNLGLALAYQGIYDEAYDHFYKATWCYAQRSAAYFALSQIDVRRDEYAKAVGHLDLALVTNAHNNKAQALKAVALRRMGEPESALQVVRESMDFDSLNHWAHNELAILTGDSSQLINVLRGDVQNYLDLAFDYANAGLYDEASEILRGSESSYPMVSYALGCFSSQQGDSTAALYWYQQGEIAPPDWCFPLRLEEQIILESVQEANPADGRAAYYLGNLYYDKKQYEKAITVWKAATQNDPDFSIPWRNLGVALYNKRDDKTGAKRCYDQALAANSDDPRLLMEMDQLLQRLGSSQADRLDSLQKQVDLVERRDDLSITFAELYSQIGQPEEALDILKNHQFHAWEGGEGGAAGQYAFAQVMLGHIALDEGNLEQALLHFQEAQNPPDNLGVGRGMSMYDVLAWFRTAEVLTVLDNSSTANEHYQKIVDAEMRMTRWGGASPLTFYAALSLRAVGKSSSADKKLIELQKFAQQKLDAGSEADFFTSRPTMVIFDDDPVIANQIQGYYLMGLANLGLGKTQEAEDNFKSVLNLDSHNWWAKYHLSSVSKVL